MPKSRRGTTAACTGQDSVQKYCHTMEYSQDKERKKKERRKTFLSFAKLRTLLFVFHLGNLFFQKSRQKVIHFYGRIQEFRFSGFYNFSASRHNDKLINAIWGWVWGTCPRAPVYAPMILLFCFYHSSFRLS